MFYHYLSMKIKPKEVRVNDLMQKGYVYTLIEPEGENFHPDFKPELTPKQMLEMGVFGGKYLTDCLLSFGPSPRPSLRIKD